MSSAGPSERLGRLWPLSALLSWTLAWGVLLTLGWLAACLCGLLLGLLHRRPWRRLVVALGLPAAALLQGVALPVWLWPVLLAALLLLYPRRLWRDAPLFLTPADAILALPERLALAEGARLIDAGCGSGAGLRAWHRAYPQLRYEGVEASALLVLWSRRRCPWAAIRHGDLWQDDWSRADIVYLFQRPESMPPALAKARAELRPGAWLFSLDFPLPGPRPAIELPAGRHRLLGYRREDLN